MKKLLLTIMLTLSLTVSAAEVKQSVNFEKGNHFSVSQQYDAGLLNNFAEFILNYDKSEMLIYFNSPGGSVVALSKMTRLMKNSNIKFTCVADFAASAAFMMFQMCDKRFINTDSILMSHNWAGSFSGEAPRILSLFNAIQGLITPLEDNAISKMTIDRKTYFELINKNLWMSSGLALTYGAADAIIDKVSCTKETLQQKIRIDGYRQVYYRSGCPLIQKIYTKSSNEKDVYYTVSKNSIKRAQRNYIMENANWIYMGDM